jgi:hypothetical protein
MLYFFITPTPALLNHACTYPHSFTARIYGSMRRQDMQAALSTVGNTPVEGLSDTAPPAGDLKLHFDLCLYWTATPHQYQSYLT